MDAKGCLGVLIGVMIFGPVGMFTLSHELPTEATIIGVGGWWACLIGLVVCGG